MTIDTLIKELQKFPQDLPVCLLVPSESGKVAIEIAQVFDSTYLPADSLVGRGDFVVLRAI